MTTAVLPLTEDEETGLRRSYGVFRPSAGSGSDTILRLFATLDAERARHTPGRSATRANQIVVRLREDIGLVAQDMVTGIAVVVTRDAADSIGQPAAEVKAIRQLRRILAAPPADAPPHSRSEAKRLAAQRGEPAPVFDAAPSVVEGMVEREGRPHTFWTTHRDAEPTGTPCSCFWGADHGDGKYIDEEYPASVVEAVRALLECVAADDVDEGGLYDLGLRAGRARSTDAETDVCIAEADAIEVRVRAALSALPAELLDAARRAT